MPDLLPPNDPLPVLTPSRVADFSEIPVVDVGPLGSGGMAEQETVRQIREACEGVGFFYVQNHGVQETAVNVILDEARRFFALPEASLHDLLLQNSQVFRGYLPPGKRGNNKKRPPDILHAFNLGPELGPEDPSVQAGKPLHGPNQWPEESELPGFRQAVMAYYSGMEILMHRILAGIALVLELPRDHFDRWFTRPLTQMRLLYYPPQPDNVDSMIGARAHQDTDFFTLLLQDDVGGLEVRNNSGEWIAVPPRQDMFVFNVGDMLETATGGRFVAAWHRVVNRTGNRARFSVPFFVSPDFDARVEPLVNFSAEDEQRYQPLHVGRYMTDFFEGLWPSPGLEDIN